MDELLSEKEQIEAMRSWWSENGTWVVLGIVIGVGGIFGLNQYRSSQLATLVEASTLFEELAAEISDDDLEPAEALAATMYSEYPETIYADQTRLAMARLYMDQGRDEDAATSLQTLLDRESDPQMQLVARLRLAKILLYQDKPEAVLSLLEGHTDTGFGAKYYEAIGDAQAQLGNHEAAEEAYLSAIGDSLSAQVVDTSLLQMKISDLPDVLPEGTIITPEGGDSTANDEAAAESVDDETMSDGNTDENVVPEAEAVE